jgi:phospholipid/cholesterol/gamma-HCH transport system substrate-binding protein
METRANHVLVGVVTLALLAALAAFLIWIVRFGEGETKEYDIFFKQSVGGLAAGTGVTFAGVPAGQVEQVELWNNDPEFVRVRISIAKNIPILQGTTATISSVSFTAPPNIQLAGAKKGAPPITEPGPGPGRVPIIPTKPGALGEILNSAPVLVQRLATLTDRLSQLLSDDNQRNFQGILANSERLTGSLADQAPQLQLLIADSRRTVASAGRTADELTQLAASGRNFVDSNGKPLADDLAKTLRSAQNSLAALDKAVQSARPGIDNLSTKTLPQVDQLVGDLQLLSRSIRSVTEQIEEGGAGSLLSAPPLPDYTPE